MPRRLAMLCLLPVAAACGDLELVRYEGFDAGVDVAEVGADVAPPTTLPASCEELAEASTLCGGDPVGTWEILRWCPVVEAFDPFDGLCPDIISEGSGSSAGTLEIAPDGYWELAWRDRALDVSFSFDLACFGGSSTPCNGAFVRGECEVVSPRCECNVQESVDDFIERGLWAPNAGTLAVTLSDRAIDHTYCVDDAQGALYLFRLDNGVDDPFRMVAVRRDDTPL